MTPFFYFVLVLQLLSAVATIGLVLLQQGKGADAGAAVAGAAAPTASTLLSRVTTGCAVTFLVLTLALGWLSPAAVAAAPAATPTLPQQQEASDAR